MTIGVRLLLAAVLLYLATGFYVVRGNEKAVVRRFGRYTGHSQSSGLHYDWPRPFRRIDRINFAAVKTLTIGGMTAPPAPAAGELAQLSPQAFLTGDQNLLQVRAQVLYRPLEQHIADYVFAQSSPEIHLSQLAEAALADLLSRSGVDYAHVQGLTELNEQLTQRLRSAAAQQRLGIEIEQAVIEAAEPPVRVKADFLDVSNARAEQARGVQEARTWAEQRGSQAESQRQRQIYEAHGERQARIIAAQGSADRFRHLVAQMRREAEPAGNYEQIRDLALQRMSWQTLQEIWPKIRKKTVVNNSGPVDVGLFPESKP